MKTRLASLTILFFLLLCSLSTVYAQTREQGVALFNEAEALQEKARSQADVQNALTKYKQALEIFKRSGDHQAQGVVLNNMANVYRSLGQYQKALELHEQSLVIKRKLGDVAGESKSLNNMGHLHLTTGDMQKAEVLLKKVGYSISLGRLALYKSDYATAKAQFEKRLKSAKENRNADALFAAHTGLGVAYEGLKEYERAVDHYRQAVDLTEQVREDIPQDQRTTFYNVDVHHMPRLTPYEGLARVLLLLNWPAESFKQAESTKSRTFSESLSRRSAIVSHDVPKDVLVRDEDITNRLAARAKGLQQAYEKGAKEAVVSLEKQVKELRTERDAHVAKLRKEYPLFAATKYPQPMDLKDSALRDDEWVVEYQVTDSGICIYLMKGKQIVKALFKPVQRKELIELVRRFRAPFEGVKKTNFSEKLNSFDLDTGKKLSDILLSDILPDLPKNVPVIVVPDGCLGVLPFEMLVLNSGGRIVDGKKGPTITGAEFLGDRNAISCYQSITALTLVRTLGKSKGSGGKLLVMADPVLDISDIRAQKGNLPDLKLSRLQKELNETAAKQMVTMIAVEEAQGGSAPAPRLEETNNLANALRSLYSGQSDIFTGFDATKDLFLKQISPKLEEYQEIVFATHGYFGKDLPGIVEPVLMLTAVPPGTDGYLKLSEVMGLKMNADTVALVACMSGLGRNISGEGTMGMGRAFQYAGAKSVLMSLWSVAEKTSVQLTESFFRHRKEGKGKLEALRLARNEVRQSGFDHPFFWAPFILVGEVGTDPVGAQTAAAPKVASTRPPKQEKERQGRPEPSASLMSPTPRDPAKDKDLLEAAGAGDVAKVKKLLSEGADIGYTDPEYGGTALHWAAAKGHKQAVTLLLEKGARVNATNREGRTALIMATGLGHRQVVEVLLKHKADKSIKDNNGMTALDWAKGKNHGSIAKLLKK